MPMGRPDPWTIGGQPVETPWIRVTGLLKARCTSNAFSTFLEVTDERGADSPARPEFHGDLAAPFGLHLVDFELAIGTQIALVQEESKSYLSGGMRRIACVASGNRDTMRSGGANALQVRATDGSRLSRPDRGGRMSYFSPDRARDRSKCR